MLKKQILEIIPVLPSQNIERDLNWYKEKVGFQFSFGDPMYAGIQRDTIIIHLQRHADAPLLGGSAVRIFVHNMHEIFEEMLEREL